MPKTCPQCKYYSSNNDETKCPDCRADLKFTLLGPANAQPAPIQDITPVAPELPLRRHSRQQFFKGGSLDLLYLVMKFRIYWMLGGLLLVPLLAIGTFSSMEGALTGDPYDQIEIGMTRAEVESILHPGIGSSSHFAIQAGQEETVTTNDMVLVFRDGILVEKSRLEEDWGEEDWGEEDWGEEEP